MSNNLVLSIKTPALTCPPVSAPVSPAVLCGRQPPVRVRTLGAGGGAPARHPAAGARGQAVMVGEGQGLDVPGELHRGLQFQKHDVVVMVQVGGAALVPRVGDSSSHLPHLLPSLHTCQDMLAQVHSVPSVGARSRWSEGSRSSSPFPSPVSPFPTPLPYFQRCLLPHPWLQFPPSPLLGLPVHTHTPTSPSNLMLTPCPSQPNSNLIFKFCSTHAPCQLQSHPHPSLPHAPHTPLDSALRWGPIWGAPGLPRRAAALALVGLPARAESGGYRCSHQGGTCWSHWYHWESWGTPERCLVEERTC